jgi:hypothetical protein
MKFGIVLLCVLSTTVACSNDDDDDNIAPETGTESHWLRACENDTQCGETEGLSCICRTCSRTCKDPGSCDGTSGASTCFTSNTTASMVLCGDSQALSLCLPECSPEDDSCGTGQACVQGTCMTLAALPTTMSCGAQTCEVGQQYCYSFSGGVPGSSSESQCKPIPDVCKASPDCECLVANSESLTSCQVLWPGAILAGTQTP